MKINNRYSWIRWKVMVVDYHRTRRLSFAAIIVCFLSAWHSLSGRGPKDKLLPKAIAAPTLAYNNTFLDNTSMWAMGANARTIPPLFHNVPLVRWTNEAVEVLESQWKHLHSSASCDRAMYIYPHDWGITSQIRDFSDAAIVALAFERPLRVVQTTSKTSQWCQSNAWLECFFQPLSGRTCQKSARELQSMPPFLPSYNNGSARHFAHQVFAGPYQLHMDPGSQFTFVLDDPRFFPTKLWKRLVAEGHIYFTHADDQHVSAKQLSETQPELFHALSVSAIRTILSGLLFKPNADVVRRAKQKMCRLGIQHPGDCIALHLRWTDKPRDGGVAKYLQPNVRHVEPAMARAQARLGRLPSCVLLLTDDDEGVMQGLRSVVTEPFKLVVLTRVSDYFTSHEAYESYQTIGHGYFRQHEIDHKYDYYASVVVDAVIASNARILIGVGSSGVSQLISQYIGFRHKVDANAFAIWQEDMVM